MGERLEGKTSEGHCRRIDGDRCFRVEEEWSIQAWRVPQPETEEEASHPGTQRRESIYQGALRLQGKARLQDRTCVGDEEVEGNGELNAFQRVLFSSIPVGGRTGWRHKLFLCYILLIRVGGLAGSHARAVNCI